MTLFFTSSFKLNARNLNTVFKQKYLLSYIISKRDVNLLTLNKIKQTKKENNFLPAGLYTVSCLTLTVYTAIECMVVFPRAIYTSSSRSNCCMACPHTHTALSSATHASYESSVISQMKFGFLPQFCHIFKETRPKPQSPCRCKKVHGCECAVEGLWAHSWQITEERRYINC